MFSNEAIPDLNLVKSIYTHKLNDLVEIADLEKLRKEVADGSPQFAAYWSTVSDWSVTARYEIIDKFKAAAMNVAMSDEKDGVFEWLQENC